MPTYDYRCTACSHTFEHFQAISDPLLVKCPECGRKKLERLIGAGAGLLFKGSGFYITDYRSSSYQEAAKKDSAAPAASGGDSGKAPAKESSSGDGKSAPATPSAAPTAPSKSSGTGKSASAPSKSGGSRAKR